jgi:hypothetical protein
MAAPAIPILNRKIKIGSNIIFITEVTIIIFIETFDFPIDLRELFRQYPGIPITEPKIIITI